MPACGETTVAPVSAARSPSCPVRESPNPGDLTAQIFRAPRKLFDGERGGDAMAACLCPRALRRDPSMSIAAAFAAVAGAFAAHSIRDRSPRCHRRRAVRRQGGQNERWESRNAPRDVRRR